MSQHDDEGAGFFRRNRGLAIAGITGLAVISAGGAYLVNKGQDVDSGDVAAISTITAAPLTTAPPASEAPSASPAPARPAPVASSSSARATSAVPPSPSVTTTDDTRAGERRVQAARDAAAKDGVTLKRPLPAAEPRDTSSRTEETRTLPGGGTMRIVTGRYDLSGGRELAWAADKGQEVDGARCTQNFVFSANSKPAVRPTMLLCWRTSAERSVVVVTVEKSGPPSMTQSAAVIDQKWKKLG